jgi:hypothetical protein
LANLDFGVARTGIILFLRIGAGNRQRKRNRGSGDGIKKLVPHVATSPDFFTDNLVRP